MSSERSRAAPVSRPFAVDVAWTLGARILMTVNSVAAGIIVARWLGAEGLGKLAVINVAVATAVQFGSAGLPSANTYFIAQDNRRFAPVVINSLIFAIVVGSLLALGLTIITRSRPDWFGFIEPRLIGIAALAIPFMLVSLIGLNVFLAVGRVARFNLLDLAGQSFVLVNAIVALVILGAGLWLLVTLNAAASIALGILIAILVLAYGAKIKDRLSWRPDLHLFGRMLQYGLKFHVSILAGALIFRADLLLVNHFRGPAEAGVYSIATQVSIMMMMLPSVIATLLFPRVTAEQDAQGETTRMVTRHVALLMALACLAAVPLSFVLPGLFGPGFSDLTIQLLILLPGVYLIGIESVLVQHFNALGLPSAIPLFWVAALAADIFLLFLLVPRFGARGGALASSITYAIIFALILFYFRYTTGNPISRVLVIQKRELLQLLNFARGRGRLKLNEQ